MCPSKYVILENRANETYVLLKNYIRDENCFFLFSTAIVSCQIAEELKSWNMEMSDRLLRLSGRIMPCENIILGSQFRCDAGSESDWTSQLRCE